MRHIKQMHSDGQGSGEGTERNRGKENCNKDISSEGKNATLNKSKKKKTNKIRKRMSFLNQSINKRQNQQNV